MANEKISQMPGASFVGPTDLVPIVQSGTNYKATVSQIIGSGAPGTFTVDSSANVTCSDVACNDITCDNIISINTIPYTWPSVQGATGTVLTDTDGLGTLLWVGAATSVSNSDGTLTITPTTGDVVASLNLAQANTWTAVQVLPSLNSDGGLITSDTAGNLTAVSFIGSGASLTNIPITAVTGGTNNNILYTNNTGVVSETSNLYYSDASGNMVITGAADAVELTVTSFTGQTSNLQNWTDSSSNPIAWVDVSGNFTTAGNLTAVDASLVGAADAVELTVTPFTGQTSNLQNWTDSSSNPIAWVDVSGNFTAASLTANNGASNTDALGSVFTAGICTTVGAGGVVTSVSNSDNTLVVTPTTGDVVASLNLAQANTWTAVQVLPSLNSDGGLITSDTAGNLTAVSFIGSGASLVGAADAVELTVTPFTGQTSNLQNWTDSSSNPIAWVDVSGNFTIASLTATGTIVSINGVNYAFPSSQGATGSVLTDSDGAGTLTWVTGSLAAGNAGDVQLSDGAGNFVVTSGGTFNVSLDGFNNVYVTATCSTPGSQAYFSCQNVGTDQWVFGIQNNAFVIGDVTTNQLPLVAVAGVGVGLNMPGNPPTPPINACDISGGCVIGADDAGTVTAPTNGLSVEGAVIGASFSGLLNYTAGDPTQWATSPPTDVATALDRLAVAVAGLLGSPIP